MNKLMHAFLDQIADRVTALIARLVAGHIEIKCAEYEAEIQYRIDEMAARYEEAGHAEVAAQVRRIQQKLATGAVVPTGEAILDQVQSQNTVLGLSETPKAEPAASAIRQRRASSKRTVSLPEITDADGEAPGEVAPLQQF